MSSASLEWNFGRCICFARILMDDLPARATGCGPTTCRRENIVYEGNCVAVSFRNNLKCKYFK